MERERQDFKKSRVNISSSLTAESKDQVLLQLKVTNAHTGWLLPRNIFLLLLNRFSFADGRRHERSDIVTRCVLFRTKMEGKKESGKDRGRS